MPRIWTIAFLAWAMMFLPSCTDEASSRRALMSAGFTDIVFTGYEWFGCGKDDEFHTGFKAKNVRGETVSGVVCCGLFKSCTVRF